MNITIWVPGVLRASCGGVTEFEIPAESVRTALQQIASRYPELHRNVCDETGAVRRHVNLFVNSSNVRDLNGLDSTLTSGDVVMILPAVSGG
jgi:adenylyltransferase/sulfurtransferase